ncbi:MAG: helix-turn-helix domain-containing protein [Janthinobacterium lividum]
MKQTASRVGGLLREWRHRRNLSQLDLALEADISARHLSFLETGRSQPSREMVLGLAARLAVPLREQNALLIAAGYAPVFLEHSFTDPALTAARQAVELVLSGHEPYPALAIDRHWTMIAANRAIAPLLGGVASDLLLPPVNVLRLSLHPEGLAPRITNLSQWRTHLLDRLRQQTNSTADPVLQELYQELMNYPASLGSPAPLGSSVSHSGLAAPLSSLGQEAGIVVPLQLMTPGGSLTLLSTTTVFGMPLDVTLSEIAVEAFFPADDASATILREFAATS